MKLNRNYVEHLQKHIIKHPKYLPLMDLNKTIVHYSKKWTDSSMDTPSSEISQPKTD